MCAHRRTVTRGPSHADLGARGRGDGRRRALVRRRRPRSTGPGSRRRRPSSAWGTRAGGDSCGPGRRPRRRARVRPRATALRWNSATSMGNRTATRSSGCPGRGRRAGPCRRRPTSPGRPRRRRSRDADLGTAGGHVLQADQPPRHHRPGLATPRARIARKPESGIQPRKSSCSSRTIAPVRQGCCPTGLPTGPEKLPDWTGDAQRRLALTGQPQALVRRDRQTQTAVAEGRPVLARKPSLLHARHPGTGPPARGCSRA